MQAASLYQVFPACPHPARPRKPIRLESKIASAHAALGIDTDKTQTRRKTQTRTQTRDAETHTRPPSCCSCRGPSRTASCCFAASMYRYLYLCAVELSAVACMHQQIKAQPSPWSPWIGTAAAYGAFSHTHAGTHTDINLAAGEQSRAEPSPTQSKQPKSPHPVNLVM